MTYRETEARWDNEVAEYRAEMAHRLGTDEPPPPLQAGERLCRYCGDIYDAPGIDRDNGLCWTCDKFEEAEWHRAQEAMHTGRFEE